MHIVTLMHEAKELMETGWISLPRPEAQHLIDIRLGRFPLYAVIEESDRIQRLAIEARDKSPLPEKLDRDIISTAISTAYLDFWKTRA